MNEVNEKRNSKGLILVSIIVLLIVGLGTFFLIRYLNGEKKTPPEELTPPTEEKEKITPLMYEITKEGSDNKIYLIGSIHYANIPKLEFPKYVMDAYNNSNYMACEFDIVKTLENLDQTELLAEYYYTAPDSLDKHVSKESYDKIIKYMNDTFKYDEEQVKILSLTYIDALLTQLAIAKSDIGNTQEGVDTYFLNKAHAENKKILEVESYEFQDNLEKSFPDRVKEIGIIDAIENFDDGVQDLNDLYDGWKKGDLEKLNKLLTEEDMDDYSEEDKALMKDYNKKMLDDRNIGMRNKLEEYFNNGYTVFYMVGAAHLIGDNGIAKLVELDGYTVTRVQ